MTQSKLPISNYQIVQLINLVKLVKSVNIQIYKDINSNMLIEYLI